MQLDEVLTIFTKESLKDKFLNNCPQITTEMREKCYSFIIKDNLINYHFSIDQKEQLIKYNLNETKEFEDKDSLQDNIDILNQYSDFDREASFTLDIEEQGFYYFFVSHCQDDNYTFTVNYVALNPGDEHLSFDLIPNKMTYAIFSLTWIGMLVFSTVIVGRQAIKTRRFNYVSALL